MMKRHTGILNSIMTEDAVIPEIEQTEKLPFAQGKTGYCWLVAVLFFLSERAGMEKQRFSMDYLMYYDKMEKAEYFLSGFMNHMDEPLTSLDNRYLLSNPISDRGQWGMAVNLIRKYGLVPYNENNSSMIPPQTGELNACLSYILRCFAKKIREAFEQGSPENELFDMKEEALQKVRNLLTEYYGCPVGQVTLENGDSVTPQKYLKQLFGDVFGDYVSIISNNRMQLGQYKVDLDGNVTSGVPNTFLNLPEDVFRRSIDAQMDGDGCCVFTADAGKFYLKDYGLFDDSIFDLSIICGDIGCESVNRSDVWSYHLGNPVHTMVLLSKPETGMEYYTAFNSAAFVDKGGICKISRSWFQKFVLQAVVSKKYIPDIYLGNAEKSVVVKPWELI